MTYATHPIVWKILFNVWAFSILFLAYGTAVGVRSLRKAKRTKGLEALGNYPQGYPPISILKPLKGIDEGLRENLETFFHLDYPTFELRFCVASANDPAIPLIEEMIARYPHVNALLTVGASNIGSNPKVNNIFRSYKQARYDWILINDSNTRVLPDYLRVLAARFGEGVAMQSSIVFGSSPQGLGGELEATFLNTYYARNIMGLAAIGHPCVMGKAMMFRRSLVEQIGGLASFGKYIAEDYMAGHILHSKGFKVQICHNTIEQYIGKHSFQAFWARHVRWSRLRKVQAIGPYLVEPFISAVGSAIIGAIAMHARWGISPALFITLHMAFWFVCDVMMMQSMGQAFNARTPLVWMIRELTNIPLWIATMSGNTIEWRGQKIKLARHTIPVSLKLPDPVLEETAGA